jgi:hypothetical protein
LCEKGKIHDAGVALVLMRNGEDSTEYTERIHQYSHDSVGSQPPVAKFERSQTSKHRGTQISELGGLNKTSFFKSEEAWLGQCLA